MLSETNQVQADLEIIYLMIHNWLGIIKVELLVGDNFDEIDWFEQNINNEVIYMKTCLLQS